MSQAKVDRNKELKRNKKKIVKRQKRERVFGTVIGVLVAALLLSFIGFSGYRSYLSAHADDPKPSVEVDLSAVQDYEANLNSNVEEETTDESATEEGEAEESSKEDSSVE